MGEIVKFVICFFIIFNLSVVLAIGIQFPVGYTSYDWQLGGPVSTWCRTDPIANGVHVCWLFSNFSPAIDRNRKYNFYNCTTHSLHSAEGEIVYTQRSGFGNMDYNPITGCAVVITHQNVSGGLRVNAARDQAPGACIFDYCIGPLSYSDPVISVSYNQAIHCAMMDYYTNDSLWYARIQPWCSWSTPINICSPAPQPMFHSQNIAASKISNKVVIVWECSEDPWPERAYYRLSNDGGLTWQPPTQLPFPSAQGMIPSFTISSLFGMIDNQDNLHIVASVADTGHTIPAGIWHWCPINNPQWSCIYFYNPDTLAAPVGYNAIFATRPSIVQASNTGYLYVAWEQFDSLNYEPLSNLARADIWIAESPNNGLTWQNQQPITTPNTTSKRYPCAGGVDHDTLSVAYMIDSIAGFENYTQGRTTRNPIVLHRIKVPLPSGIEEQFTHDALRFTIDASPNPFTSYTVIRYGLAYASPTLRVTLPAQSKVSLELYDVTGRLIKSLTNIHHQTSNIFSVIWDGKDNNGIQVKSGVYFYTLKTADKIITNKIIKTN
jgi:hypothetical protein